MRHNKMQLARPAGLIFAITILIACLSANVDGSADTLERPPSVMDGLTCPNSDLIFYAPPPLTAETDELDGGRAIDPAASSPVDSLKEGLRQNGLDIAVTSFASTGPEDPDSAHFALVRDGHVQGRAELARTPHGNWELPALALCGDLTTPVRIR